MKKALDIPALLRPNVRELVPYSSARSEYGGSAEVFLDANESPYENRLPLKLPYLSDDRRPPSHSPTDRQAAPAREATQLGSGCAPLNRYPDPLQKRLKATIASRYLIQPQSIFLGNGSDEAIDLLYRAFCQPREDKALHCPPTYSMYQVSANINEVDLLPVPLTEDFQPDVPAVLQALETHQPKMLFLCSPNNPTGNAMDPEAVEAILEAANCIVVIDEAYGDFAPEKSFLDQVKEWPHLVILKTFSKAWGLAALRLGMAVANPVIIEALNRIKPPYNLGSLTQEVALSQILGDGPSQQVKELQAERERLRIALSRLEGVEEIYPSDANFLLVRFKQAGKVFEKLRGQGIIIRDRRSYVPDTLRITVGRPIENQLLLHQLESFYTNAQSIN